MRPGDVVWPIEIGTKPAFLGRIIERHSGWRFAWIVEDLADGTRWHRTLDELRKEKPK